MRLRNGTYADAATIQATMTWLRSMTGDDRKLALMMAGGGDPGSSFRRRYKLTELTEAMANIIKSAVKDNGTLRDHP